MHLDDRQWAGLSLFLGTVEFAMGLTIAEIEPLVPRVVSRYFAQHNFDVVANPKTHVELDDARHYLLTTRQTFDAITSDPLDP